MKNYLSGFIFCAIVASGCSKHDSAATPLPSQTATAEVELSDPAKHDSPTSGPFKSAPLPQGAYLKDVVNQLKARATAGDPVASCQLANELDFCSSVQQQNEDLLRSQKIIGATDAPKKSKADFNNSVDDLIRIRAAYCEGVAAAPASERAAYWRKAALAGYTPAILNYASGAVFQRDDTLSVLDDLQLYRQSAVTLMKKASADGSWEATLRLASAYSPNSSDRGKLELFPQAVDKRDAIESLAYYFLLQRGFENESAPEGFPKNQINFSIEHLMKLMNQDDLKSAEQRYQQLRGSVKPLSKKTWLAARGEREAWLATPTKTLCGAEESPSPR